MAAVTDRWRRILPKIQAPPEWGIEPVPENHRVLGFLDYFILWGDLGIGLLVLLAGSFLVPGLGLGDALLAAVVGSVLGCLLLALVGVIGSDNAIPTMVLLRPVLGVRGSYVPTVFNVLQLIGWTIFEFVIMGFAADAISQTIFGFSSLPLWTAVFAAIVILMGIGGPIGVVRQWLEKFAVWIVLITTGWLTFHLLTTYNLAALFKPGDGSLTFGVAVDLVIAMPISWLPLVADYNRFARQTTRAFWGTFIGYLITNVWFYALGAMVLLAAGVSQEPKGFVSSIALTAGWVALLILLVDETDNAWADLYSAAVSVQNAFPKIKQRWLILGLGILAYLVAVVLDVTQYENFLFLAGSLFVPLFGILTADYFLLRRRKYTVDEFYGTSAAGVNVWGIIAWIAGIIVYHVTNPTTLGAFIADWQKMIPDALTAYGGSLPSFIAAFVIYAALAFAFLRKK
ncbi:MAG: putative hydroxymethylpyrimidine transporter CytX [Chloroflexota bacterium]|nr:putative hydroxymethylpyrimidine transporter CytX [Chloroflexota bacterium]